MSVVIGLLMLLNQDQSSAEALIKAIGALKAPAMTGSDEASLKKWLAETEQISSQRNELIWKLYLADPKHEKVPAMLAERWDEMFGRSMPTPLYRLQALEKDLNQFLANTQLPANRQVAERLRVKSMIMKQWRTMRDNQWKSTDEQAKHLFETALQSCDGYYDKYPQDESAAYIYYYLTNISAGSANEQVVMQRLVSRFPTSSVGIRAKGRLRSLQAIGQSFELRFTDVLTNKEVDIKDYRGQVILIDFWSLGCAPCRLDIEKELPKLLEEYREKGLVILGVNMDQGLDDGRDYPLEYIKDKKITWSNYCTRSGTMKGYTADWGVFALPTQFLVDRQGNLRFIDATKDRKARIELLLAEPANKK